MNLFRELRFWVCLILGLASVVFFQGCIPVDPNELPESSVPPGDTPDTSSSTPDVTAPPEETPPPTPVDVDGDGFSPPEDCDDTNTAIYQGAVELCNGIDDNCKDGIDEGVTYAHYADADGDGFGAGKAAMMCDAVGYVADNTDCDDDNPDIHPGATEQCNDTDDDCDVEIDEGISTWTWYRDGDNDGFGDEVYYACAQPDGYVDIDSDCDDADPEINPDANEQCDGIDNDCDGEVDEGVLVTY